MYASISFVVGPLIINGDGSKDQTGTYYILISDDSGNPTNGDNIIVQYQDSLGNPVQTATIAGQSRKIFVGNVQHINADGSNGPFLEYRIVSQTGGDSPSPPINPDLTLVSITVTKKADSAGNNGEVTILATSSFPPINYTVDTAIVSPSGVFIHLGAGVHTVVITDSTDITITQDFTVTMADSILISTPAVTKAGLTSRWNAAFNPVIFTYQRKDFDVTAIAQDDTTLKPKITLNTTLTGVVVGDYVYMQCGVTSDYVTYKGIYQVLSVGVNYLIIDTDYVAPDEVSGFCNIDSLRPYYKVITKIKYVDPSTGQFNTITSINRPINGITKADLSSFLQSLLQPQPDQSDYTALNYRDKGLGASYQISYAETWEGNTPIWNDIEDPFYIVYSARQVQQDQNLFDQVTQPGGTQLAKWLSDFFEPSYSVNFPFDLPFIYSEQVAGRQLYYKFIALDINRNPLGDTEYTSFLLNEDESYLLNQDGSKFIIARQQLVSTDIVEQVGVNRLLINQDFGPTAFYISVQLFYDDEDTPVPVTEVKIVKIDQACPLNPVYLRWIGLNGSWNYFRFNYNQTKTLDVQNPVIIKDYIENWLTAEGIERVLSKDASEKLQVYADQLSANDINGLKSLKFSPNVQVLTGNNPLKWQTIVVNSATFNEYETNLQAGDFTITFNYPSINIQTQ